MGRSMAGLRFVAPFTASARLPYTVSADVSMSCFLASSASTALTPPAACRSSIASLPAGASLQRLGVIALTLFRSSGKLVLASSVKPASCAMAGRCSAVLVEQPSAISNASAFINAFSVRMVWGRISLLKTSSARIPVFFASRILSAMTAGIVPLPGKASPSASVTQFMELAVNIPEQEPQPGQAASSISASSASLILPAPTAPTASNIEVSVSGLLFLRPASIGPPETNTDGRLSRAAAISIPGTILSQLGIKMSASNPCAITMHSMESAMSSRVTSE